MKTEKIVALLKDYETKVIVGYAITAAKHDQVVYFGFGAGDDNEILYLCATGSGLKKATIDRSMTPQNMRDIIEEMNLFQFAVTLVSEPGRKRI